VRIARSASRLATTKARRRIPTKTTGVGPDPGTSAVARVAVGGTVAPAVDPAVGLAVGDVVGLAVGDVVGLAVGDVVGLAVGDVVGVAVGDVVGVAVGDVVGDVVGAPVTHGELVMVSLIKVTVPFRASARPLIFTPLFIVMDVRARMVPTKVEPDPSVAELVTCQKTLHELAPLMSFTELDDAVTRSDAAWKTQTELGSFWPSSVKVPVSARAPPL
jgi:hypothetical protein